MKATLAGSLALFIAAVLLALVQLWFTPWSAEVFIKLEITVAGLWLIVMALWFARKEYREFRRQQTNVQLDE